MVTLSPRDFKSRPIDEAAIPLPNDETTPPVRNINFTLFINLFSVLPD
jgi:hypothetical protein